MMEPLARIGQFGVAMAQRVQLAMMPRLLQGPGIVGRVPEILADRGVDTVLIVTTAGFVRRGSIDGIKEGLRKRGVIPIVFSDVQPDPDIECVVRAADKYRHNDCQAIVAFGGGSVIDCAKVVGALAVNPKRTVRDLMGTMQVRAKTPFLIAIPTTAGTGSEVTAAAVITDSERQRKFAVSDLVLIPDVAVLDPELLVGLPADMTAFTGMDALTHAVEAYTNRFGSTAARRYAKQAVALVFEHLKASHDDGADLHHRGQMLLASYYAGIAFSNAMVGYVHALAHGIGGRYHVQHGLANAVLLPYVLEEFGAAAEPRLAELAQVVGIVDGSQHDRAQEFIQRIRELSASMGIPRTIAEIREEDIPQLAAGAEEEGNPAYPVPAIWDVPTFEKVLRQAAGFGSKGDASAPASSGAEDQAETVSADESLIAAEGAGASRMPSEQVHITEEGELLDELGRLRMAGWATSQLLSYDRSRIAVSPLRIKEWDYYLVNDDDFALAFTIGDMGYAAMVSASLLDFGSRTFITESTLGVLPLGRLALPAASDAGVTQYEDGRVRMRFDVVDGQRLLTVEFDDFKDGAPLHAQILLDDEPRDSMVIATPWAEDAHAFYYNQKIVAMRAQGVFDLGDMSHVFEPAASFGLLDWGRGVWTRDNTWFWSAAQGRQAGHRVGFNLGYGFGDTKAASENMFFLDGVAHKLGRVDFGIPIRDAVAEKVGERFDFMLPWHMTDDEGRLDLSFTPEIDRCDYLDFKVIISDQHQVFGTFSGTVRLDDGTLFEIEGLRGFAEAVHNMY